MESGTPATENCAKAAVENRWMEGKHPFIPEVNNCVAWPAAWIYLKAAIVQTPQSQTASSNSPANWFDWSASESSHDTTDLLIMSHTCFKRGHVHFFPLVLIDSVTESLSYRLFLLLERLDPFSILCFNSSEVWSNFSFSETLINTTCQNDFGS